MKDGDVILLQNTRYRAEETKNGEEFSKELASLADVFVNDAFGTAHRAHCSNVGVTKYIKGDCVVGYLMQKEIKYLTMRSTIRSARLSRFLAGQRLLIS